MASKGICLYTELMKIFDALFFDVDQTIYDSQRNIIIPSTIEAIALAQKKGLKCIICTGRPLDLVKNTVMDKDIAWDGYITSNGATVLDKDLHCLHDHPFPAKTVQSLLKMAEEKHCSLTFQTVYKTFSPVSYEDQLEKGFVFFNIAAPKPKIYEDEPVSMAVAFADESFDFHVFDHIEGVKAIVGKAPYADITQKGIDKGYGLKKAKEAFHFQQVIAFGDADNDLEMIQEADYGIAMGNGTENIKAISDMVTDEMKKDGVYKALKKLNIL